MANKPNEPSIRELNRKLKRLELLVLALVASDGSGFDGDSRDLHYLFKRFFRDQDEFRDDRDFYHFFEHLIYESRDRGSNLRQTVQHLEGLVKESQHQFQEQAENSKFRIQKLVENVQELKDNLKLANKELHHYLIFQPLGDESNNIELDRFIPVRVYLSDDNQVDIDKITNAVDKLLEAFEFSFSDDSPAEKGSWWKKWFAKSKDAVTQQEVVNRLKKIERAIDLHRLHKPQADVDKTQAEAIAVLIASVKEMSNVAIHAGSILLVKVIDGNGASNLQVRCLSTKELIYLENNQHLLCKPEKVMESLSCNSSNKQLPEPE